LKKVSVPLTWETAPSVLTAEEAAALVRIPRSAFYGAIKAGLVPHHNFGSRLIRIDKTALQQVFGVKLEHRPVTAAFSHTGGVQ
jgi:excisionase family DNA binding protein